MDQDGVRDLKPTAMIIYDLGYDPKIEGNEVGQSSMPEDIYNAPYARKMAILRALGWSAEYVGRVCEVEGPPRCTFDSVHCAWLPGMISNIHEIHEWNHRHLVHNRGMVEYLKTAWDRWMEMPAKNRCKFFRREKDAVSIPALVPSNFAQRSERGCRAGTDIHSQTCWYHTDDETPIFEGLWDTLEVDLAVDVCTAMDMVKDAINDHPHWSKYYYALVTHPGHHAGRSSIGGYCYVNNAAVIANMLTRHEKQFCKNGVYEYKKVAILDVDYHCGNGTISIFWDRPDVFVASIHADPSGDYPWNSGFADQVGEGDGEGTTLNLPLPRGVGWTEYRVALKRALAAIKEFGAEAIIVSLGLDTHIDDPVQEKATAGMRLTSEDYFDMGKLLAGAEVRLCFVQEGGYQVDVAGALVAQVLKGVQVEFERQGSRKRDASAASLDGFESS